MTVRLIRQLADETVPRQARDDRVVMVNLLNQPFGNVILSQVEGSG